MYQFSKITIQSKNLFCKCLYHATLMPYVRREKKSKTSMMTFEQFIEKSTFFIAFSGSFIQLIQNAN